MWAPQPTRTDTRFQSETPTRPSFLPLQFPLSPLDTHNRITYTNAQSRNISRPPSIPSESPYIYVKTAPKHSPINPHCLPFDTPDASLSRVGGKGLNLAKLAKAGIPVPNGYIITTRAYSDFVDHAGLTGWMADQTAAIDTTNPLALASLSDHLRARIQNSEVPTELSSQITAAYAHLGRPAVAVRSSATAEDLPGMSFAGQQDTFLNVIEEDALLQAVVNCWSSLWTARAIAYRARYNIDQSTVALAVVVQKMVQSEISGVLFTANPLTGKRSETVIDAAFGLGEALVSGQVEPDHFVLDTATCQVLHQHLGAKATTLTGAPEGGIEANASDRAAEQTLSQEHLTQLTRMGTKVAALYDEPQDIEWAIAGGKLFLLQSRPITSLFPLPPSAENRETLAYISLGAIQGVLTPFTPLGMDVLRGLFAGIANLASPGATLDNQPLLHSVASRPWINISPALRNPVGRLIFSKALPMVEPGGAQAIQELISGPLFVSGPLRPRFVAVAAPFILRLLTSIVRAFLQPDKQSQAVKSAVEAHIASVEARIRKAATFDQRIDLLEWLCYNAQFPFLLPLFMPTIIAGYVSLNLLSQLAAVLARRNPEIEPSLALELTRSLPKNVTTEMDLELWQVAQQILRDTVEAASFKSANPEYLDRLYASRDLTPSTQSALESFLDRYGMRGLAELDIGQPRWAEQPLPIIRSLQSYISLDDREARPDRVFRNGQESAARATDRLASAASSAFDTPLAGWIVRQLAKRVRSLSGFRESPKFAMVSISGMIRAALLESGQEFADKGVLEGADDIFYLTMRELKTLAMDAPGDRQKLVRFRREEDRRERSRRSIPRIILSDGTAFYAGLAAAASADEKALVGSGVSPGLVEGPVQVVINPLDTKLKPGDILVCPGTDPSWTPLFLAAGGLITEVGGMMTHGSVVAREYGIPAVVGVDRATERLQTSQKVRINGGSGTIELLD